MGGSIWRRQQNDVIRLDDLALLCRGRIAVAAVLALRNENVATVAQAEKFAETTPDKVAALLKQQRHSLLYYSWIAECMDRIRLLLSKINFDLVSTVRHARISTSTIFEDVFSSIIGEIDRTHGVMYSVNEIFKDELGGQKPNNLVIKLLSDVRLAVLEMKRLCWRLLHPSVYIITDVRLISGLVSISLFAVPVWYFFGYHPSALNSSSPATMVQDDVAKVLGILYQPDQSWLTRMLNSAHYVFEATLFLPSIFLLPAAVLAIARQILPAGKYRVLKSFEEGLYSIGVSLQKQLPNPPKGPTVVIGGKVMTGDDYKHYGQGSQGPQSTTNVYMGAWKDVEGHVDLQKLSAELEQLRVALKAKPHTTVEEDEAIAAIGGAALAAQKGDGPGTLERLANAGKWALKVATDIGVKVAAEAITKALGVK